eukprot:CAMPEP_0174943876 /NCGR_PEP_ID=MMETSP1355-20121228/77810_1 /TAXON_ID=464990 /ORGANISM="Hemiselmis tepida, Strain CCMP443" /LENGTH=57 /DNA_ID=CAMNT_0016191149 /DNA_START=317 /DNA_END=487 /DNA_ORIENTATION=-
MVSHDVLRTAQLLGSDCLSPHDFPEPLPALTRRKGTLWLSRAELDCSSESSDPPDVL